MIINRKMHHLRLISVDVTITNRLIMIVESTIINRILQQMQL